MKLKRVAFAALILTSLASFVGLYYRNATTAIICVSNSTATQIEYVNISTSSGDAIKSFNLRPLSHKQLRYSAKSDNALNLTLESNGNFAELKGQGYITTNMPSRHTFLIGPDVMITYSDNLDVCQK